MAAFIGGEDQAVEEVTFSGFVILILTVSLSLHTWGVFPSLVGTCRFQPRGPKYQCEQPASCLHSAEIDLNLI